jgi:tetratricopeptide (TPR) repeat protein
VIWRWISIGLLCSGLVAVAQDGSGQQALRRAVELHESGHFDEAITQYQAFLKEHPEAAPVRSNLGAALAHQGRYAEAVQEYTQALSAQPANNGIRFNLGLAYYKMGQIGKAIENFEAVESALPPDQPQAHQVKLLLGESLLRLDKNARVIALLTPLAETDPNDLGVAYLLGTALLHDGQEQRGAELIERILHNGDTAEAHMLMAYTYMKANDPKVGLSEVNRAINLNPKLPEAYSLLGRLDYITADLAGAEAAFRKAIDLDPNSAEARLFLGTLLREQGRLEEAHPQLERAMQLRPGEVRARYEFALVCSAEGDDKRAADLLRMLVKDAPEYTEAHRSLSTIDFRLGRDAEGRQERKIAETLAAEITAHDQERGRSLKK